MTIFINNKSTNFCQITLRIKRLIHKKSCSFFLPHGVYWPVEVATTRYRLFTSTSILLSLSSSATFNSQSCVPSWVTWCLPSLGNELLMLVNSRLPRWVHYIWTMCQLAVSCQLSIPAVSPAVGLRPRAVNTYQIFKQRCGYTAC